LLVCLLSTFLICCGGSSGGTSGNGNEVTTIGQDTDEVTPTGESGADQVDVDQSDTEDIVPTENLSGIVAVEQTFIGIDRSFVFAGGDGFAAVVEATDVGSDGITVYEQRNGWVGTQIYERTGSDQIVDIFAGNNFVSANLVNFEEQVLISFVRNNGLWTRLPDIDVNVFFGVNPVTIFQNTMVIALPRREQRCMVFCNSKITRYTVATKWPHLV